MKILRKNYSLGGIAENGIVTIDQAVEQSYEELTVKQILLGNTLLPPPAAYKIYCPFLNSTVGLAAVGFPSKPDFHFNIKGQQLPSKWEFQIKNANGTIYGITGEELSIDIELSKAVEDK